MITSDKFFRGNWPENFAEFYFSQLLNWRAASAFCRCRFCVLFRFRFGSADLQSAAREYASFYLGIKTERHENLVPFI